MQQKPVAGRGDIVGGVTRALRRDPRYSKERLRQACAKFITRADRDLHEMVVSRDVEEFTTFWVPLRIETSLADSNFSSLSPVKLALSLR